MKGYLWVALIMGACTALGTLILPLLSVTDVAMLFLLAVGLAASRFGRGPSVAAAFLSIALFDFFFVPPRFTFAVADLHYVLTFGVMLVTALVISAVAVRLREHAEAARERERRTAGLYAMSRELVPTMDLAALVAVIARHVREAFRGQVAILLRGPEGLAPAPVEAAQSYAWDERAQAVARWAFDHWQMAGLGTSNFADAKALYLPLVGAAGRVGVLGVRPAAPADFSELTVRQVLETFAGQAAIALEQSHAVQAEGAGGVATG